MDSKRLPMQKLTIKKGYRFRMTGGPSQEITTLSDPPRVALLPEHIPYIKPRLLVAEGDIVKIGSVLLEDKSDPRFVFVSPGGGKIDRIIFGPRRVIEAIVIERQAADEPWTRFEAVSDSELDGMNREQLVDRMLQGGMWWVLRQLPFRNLPDPTIAPPLVLLGLDAQEPFQPAPAIYLQNEAGMLSFGLKVLKKLAGDERVVVFTGSAQSAVIEQHSGLLTHIVSGQYPCDDPGTVLYHLKTRASENRAWYINGQDLLLLARFLSQGRYPTERVVAVSGSAAPERRHYHTRLGAPLAHMVAPAALNGRNRVIVGGVMRGFRSHKDGYLGLYETAVNIVPEGGEAEFLALFNPGLDKPTYSRTFLSRLNPAKLVYDCNLHGERRACIACTHCARVCPVDLFPQMIHKSILAQEVEEYLQLGLLDCVECGLCSYVCPSKIELSRHLIETKAAYAKELAGGPE
jgi:Na+-transporting NADH:ubiquinone oxidoreductase subunit A